MTIKYHEAAERELLEEIGYLEVRGQGLGRRLFAEVRKAEDLLAHFPESGREVLPGVRRQILQKFPYSLFYTLTRDHLLILAFAHHSRRPGYWLGR